MDVPTGSFWALGRPVGAICHGVLVLARTRDPATGRSVLADRRTTCLPKYVAGLLTDSDTADWTAASIARAALSRASACILIIGHGRTR